MMMDMNGLNGLIAVAIGGIEVQTRMHFGRDGNLRHRSIRASFFGNMLGACGVYSGCKISVF